jgi:hypothetical protein
MMTKICELVEFNTKKHEVRKRERESAPLCWSLVSNWRHEFEHRLHSHRFCCIVLISIIVWCCWIVLSVSKRDQGDRNTQKKRMCRVPAQEITISSFDAGTNFVQNIFATWPFTCVIFQQNQNRTRKVSIKYTITLVSQMREVVIFLYYLLFRSS